MCVYVTFIVELVVSGDVGVVVGVYVYVTFIVVLIVSTCVGIGDMVSGGSMVVSTYVGIGDMVSDVSVRCWWLYW